MAYSKFEILEKVVKTTKDKSITISDVDKKIKKFKLKADEDGYYDDLDVKVLVDNFKLQTSKKKSDKALISELQKENQFLREQVREQSSRFDALEAKLEGSFDQLWDTLATLKLSVLSVSKASTEANKDPSPYPVELPTADTDNIDNTYYTDNNEGQDEDDMDFGTTTTEE